MEDLLSGLIIPVRTDTVTLELPEGALADALYDFTTASGFLAVASTDLTGNVSGKFDKTPINEVLDKLATAVSGKWQPLILLTLPREIGEAEMEQRMENRFQAEMARFWSQSPDDRAKEVQRRVEQINRWAEAARQPAENGGQNRAARALQRMGPRIMQRMVKYFATLSIDQRKELQPAMKALGAAVNQPAGGQ
jgi:hypothetical protein